jgi:putative endonuclease
MDTTDHRTGSTGVVGRDAEQRALTLLQAAGLRLVARNFRTRLGEIDLVMREQETLVFVEVRLRRNTRHGGAVPSVTPAKCRRLYAAAALFLARNRHLAALPARFDLVAFDGDDTRGQWIRGAFT